MYASFSSNGPLKSPSDKDDIQSRILMAWNSCFAWIFLIFIREVAFYFLWNKHSASEKEQSHVFLSLDLFFWGWVGRLRKNSKMKWMSLRSQIPAQTDVCLNISPRDRGRWTADGRQQKGEGEQEEMLLKWRSLVESGYWV